MLFHASQNLPRPDRGPEVEFGAPTASVLAAARAKMLVGTCHATARFPSSATVNMYEAGRAGRRGVRQ